jgi:hypothetical protein
MTGRSKNMKNAKKRINYSSFPRVQAGFAITHSLGFVFAAGATGIGGMAQRSLGQRAATAVVASILFILTLVLLGVLVRFKKIEIIPKTRGSEMDKWTQERRASLQRRASAIAAAKAAGRKDLNDIPEEDVGWRPLIVGNPSEKHRRMNILELGSLTRWTEIRKKNRLIDEGVNINRRVLALARNELEQKGQEVLDDIQRGGAMVGDLVRKVSKRSMRNKRSYGTSSEDEKPSGPERKETVRSGAGVGHNHPTTPSNTFAERENIIGLAVPEEAEDASSVEADGETDDDYEHNHRQQHASHAMATALPHTGFEQQEMRGGRHPPGGLAVNMAESRWEPISHMPSKAKPEAPGGV